MQNYSIKYMVKDNKKVFFKRYQKNQLWYVTECGFEFPIDITDTGDGAFVSEDKAMLFMRWIKKAIDNINLENKNNLIA